MLYYYAIAAWLHGQKAEKTRGKASNSIHSKFSHIVSFPLNQISKIMRNIREKSE
jgi:hypothetical protein